MFLHEIEIREAFVSFSPAQNQTNIFTSAHHPPFSFSRPTIANRISFLLFVPGPAVSLLNGACQVRYSKKVRDLEAADGERWVGEAVIFSGAAEPGSSVLHPADA